MKTNGRERELAKGMDSLMGEMNGRYGTSSMLMDENAEIERKRSDIALRDDMISHVKEVLRCRKLSEHFLDVERIDVTYEICTIVSSKKMETKIVIRDAVKLA